MATGPMITLPHPSFGESAIWSYGALVGGGGGGGGSGPFCFRLSARIISAQTSTKMNGPINRPSISPSHTATEAGGPGGRGTKKDRKRAMSASTHRGVGFFLGLSVMPAMLSGHGTMDKGKPGLESKIGPVYLGALPLQTVFRCGKCNEPVCRMHQEIHSCRKPAAGRAR